MKEKIDKRNRKSEKESNVTEKGRREETGKQRR
jgi:hypothetical protein